VSTTGDTLRDAHLTVRRERPDSGDTLPPLEADSADTGGRYRLGPLKAVENTLRITHPGYRAAERTISLCTTRDVDLMASLVPAVPAVPASRMGDARWWTTVNLRSSLQGSYCYDDLKQNCEVYGRLYTWESAGLACRALGTGWRLPTDAEWHLLARHYGGVSDDSPDNGEAAYGALSPGGISGFNAVLGGGRDGRKGTYARRDAHGFYWTSTEDGPTTAAFYNFGKGGPGLHRQGEGEKDRGFSVRCIWDPGIA
jgi:uncharacterized protein (TIGR02145 family)